MHENYRIRHKWLQIIARRAIRCMNFLERKRLRAKRAQNLVIFFDLKLELPLEPLRLNQIQDAQACARCFVAVGWPDAALGSANLILALKYFALRVQFAMIRK